MKKEQMKETLKKEDVCLGDRVRLVAVPTSVIRRGDGTLLCDKHYAEQYPDLPEPTFGWELGVCSVCAE